MTTNKIPDVVYCTALMGIPPIAERQHRPCNTCIFNPIGTPVLCIANNAYDFNIDDERTGVRMQAFIDNRYPDFEKVEKLPCRFHLTFNELKMILDPYFMEVGDDL